MFSYKNASRTLSMNKSTAACKVWESLVGIFEKETENRVLHQALSCISCQLLLVLLSRWKESMLFCSLQQSFTYLKTYDALGRLRREFKFFQSLLKTLISRLLIVLKSLTWECPMRILQSSFCSLRSLWALVPRYIVTQFQLCAIFEFSEQKPDTTLDGVVPVNPVKWSLLVWQWLVITLTWQWSQGQLLTCCCTVVTVVSLL